MSDYVFTSEKPVVTAEVPSAKYWAIAGGIALAILVPTFILCVIPGYLKPVDISANDISQQLQEVLENDYHFTNISELTCPSIENWGSKKFTCEFTVSSTQYKVQMEAPNKSGLLIVGEPYQK